RSLSTRPHHPFPTRRSSDLLSVKLCIYVARARNQVTYTVYVHGAACGARSVPAPARASASANGSNAKRPGATSQGGVTVRRPGEDRKSTRLNSSHDQSSYAV